MWADAVEKNLLGFKILEYDADVGRDRESPQVLQAARQFVGAQARIKSVSAKDALSDSRCS